MARAAELKSGERILDVGCGMGGSTIELASRYGCDVTGVTLSPVQRAWARLSAAWSGVGRRVRATGVGLLARLAGRRMQNFVNRFTTLWNAYDSGAMQYGLFVAEKP